jgi:putative restriction endonuclease
MWSPKANQNGARNQFYENMTRVHPGDLVLSFSDTRIKAIGVVTAGLPLLPSPQSLGTPEAIGVMKVGTSQWSTKS